MEALAQYRTKPPKTIIGSNVQDIVATALRDVDVVRILFASGSKPLVRVKYPVFDDLGNPERYVDAFVLAPELEVLNGD